MTEPLHFYGEYEPGMLLADVHVHTRRSDGWWEPERLAEAAVARGLAALAITDHDDIFGGDDVANAAARLGLDLDVIVGQEVSTRMDGHDVHVLALDIHSEIRPWQTIAETVDAILAQGGIPILPHPKPAGRGYPSFDQVLSLGVPVGVEIYNAGVADLARLARMRGNADANVLAREFFDTHRAQLGAAVGGTDAHFRTVGRGLTAYRGDLRTALRSGETAVMYRAEPERMGPFDPLGYVLGLRRMDARRSRKHGPRPR